MTEATKCWYYITMESCPVCGRTNTYRERRALPRPKRWEDRHDMRFDAYDWCIERESLL